MGLRRTSFEEANTVAQIVDISAFKAKEPLATICSKLGWIHSLKGHNNDLSTVKYTEGYATQKMLFWKAILLTKFLYCVQRCVFFTILADNIFRGKGNGESIKLMINIGNEKIVSMLVTSKISKERDVL